jgi:hypothetical protein
VECYTENKVARKEKELILFIVKLEKDETKSDQNAIYLSVNLLGLYKFSNKIPKIEVNM